MSEIDKTKILWWLLATLLGSTGLSTGIQKLTASVREDPFTGTQGMVHEGRLDLIEKSQSKSHAIFDLRLTNVERDLGTGQSREHDLLQSLLYKIETLADKCERYHEAEQRK